MNKLLALITALVFAVALTLVVGFVVASINGYAYRFSDALPYGLFFGLIVYLFGSMLASGESPES